MKSAHKGLRHDGSKASGGAADCGRGEVSLLAQADVLLLMADLLQPLGHSALPLPAETVELIDAAFPNADGPEMTESTQSLIECARKTPLAMWSDEYHRLFEGPIACPINETTYVRRDKGAILADICGFYLAFGFTPKPDTGEKPDHLRSELEFTAVLLVMRAQAIARGDDGLADLTMQGLRMFVAEHLVEWLASFCDRLERVTSLAVYGRLAEVLSLVWKELAACHHLPEPKKGDPEAGEHDDFDPKGMTCGIGPTAVGGAALRDLTVEGRESRPTPGV